MTTSTLSLFNKLRPVSVGFDSVFDHFESMFNDSHSLHTNYPPYDIVKTDEHSYVIELAVAGFSKKDIAVTVENGVLTVESDREGNAESSGQEIIHRGISKRYFKKSFSISDDVEIRGAELKDGLLKVSLEKIVPDHKKARTISIK